MRADTKPDDMRIPREGRCAVFEEGAAIICPRHFKDIAFGLDPLYPQALAKASTFFNVMDELLDGCIEAALFISS